MYWRLGYRVRVYLFAPSIRDTLVCHAPSKNSLTEVVAHLRKAWVLRGDWVPEGGREGGGGGGEGDEGGGGGGGGRGGGGGGGGGEGEGGGCGWAAGCDG